jgi:hypothetical protein
VLSACNTIAGDKPGAEALSGLARSFFYAGARAAGVTLVGGFGRCNPPHHRNLRSHEIRSKTRPRRGVASGDAGLSCRRNFAQKCISGILGALRVDRRGCRPLNGINCASQWCDLGAVATDGRATSRKLPNTHALQQAVEPKRERRPWNKPKLNRLTWQVRRSPLLGRRTGTGRLYCRPDFGNGKVHRDCAFSGVRAMETRVRGGSSCKTRACTTVPLAPTNSA